MSRHQRLQRTMQSPARAARRIKRQRRQAKYPEGRPRDYVSSMLPLSYLQTAWAHTSDTAAACDTITKAAQ